MGELELQKESYALLTNEGPACTHREEDSGKDANLTNTIAGGEPYPLALARGRRTAGKQGGIGCRSPKGYLHKRTLAGEHHLKPWQKYISRSHTSNDQSTTC